MTDQPSKESLERANEVWSQMAFLREERQIETLALELDAIAAKEREKEACRLAVETNRIIHTRLDSLRQQNAALVGALRWACDYIQDGLETPSHNCEYFSNPEKGSCDFCEKWADVQATLAPYAPAETKEKHP